MHAFLFATFFPWAYRTQHAPLPTDLAGRGRTRANTHEVTTWKPVTGFVGYSVREGVCDTYVSPAVFGPGFFLSKRENWLFSFEGLGIHVFVTVTASFRL